MSNITSASFNSHPAHLGVIFKVSQYTLIQPRVKIYSSREEWQACTITHEKSHSLFILKKQKWWAVFLCITQQLDENSCVGVYVCGVCVCVFCYRSTIPCYRLSDFLIILGFLHWKNKTKNSHFHNIQMEYHWNLSFKFASCFLLVFDAVHLPLDELSFLPWETEPSQEGEG